MALYFLFSLSPFCRRFEEDWGRLEAVFDESGRAKCLKSNNQTGLLHIEPEVHDVAVTDDVLLAFDVHLAGRFAA